MDILKTPSVSKGQFRCFHCRLVTKSKDGVWQEDVNQQVFICRICERARALQKRPQLNPFTAN